MKALSMLVLASLISLNQVEAKVKVNTTHYKDADSMKLDKYLLELNHEKNNLSYAHIKNQREDTNRSKIYQNLDYNYVFNNITPNIGVSSSNGSQRMNYGVKFNFDQEEKKTFIHLQYAHKSLSVDAPILGSVAKFYMTDFVNFSGLKIIDSNRLKLNLNLRSVEDTNLQKRSEFEYMYVLLNDATHWFLVGSAAEYFDHKFENADYWSPKSFMSVGPRIEYVYQYSSGRASIGTNLNRFKEDGIWGDSLYTSARIEYKIVSLHLEYGNSDAVTNWNSKGYSLGLNYQF